jgi:hypothetical protein
MFTKNGILIKKVAKYILRPFVFRKRRVLCSTKGNSKFVSNDFIKDMKPSITIIGAGISGLSVGLHLHREAFCENHRSQ